VPAAENAIAAFHSELNVGDFNKVYDNGSAELKTATSRKKFCMILNAVHSKLGLFTNGRSTGWNDSATINGHYVTINFDADYQKGSATENFVFQITGSRAVLVGYHVNSDALLLN